MNAFRGERVSTWRRTMGLNQEALAEAMTAVSYAALGRKILVTQRQISRLERGRRPEPELVRLVFVVSRGALDANELFMTKPEQLPPLGGAAGLTVEAVDEAEATRHFTWKDDDA